MTNEQYHNDTTRISKSGLDLIHKSPAHYYEAYLNPYREPRVETQAMMEGTLFHSIVLEPHLINRYFVFNDESIVNDIGGDKPRGTKRYKEWKSNIFAENEGKIAISQGLRDNTLRMANAILEHPAARELLRNYVPEVTTFWIDERTGAKCKCRPDAVCPSVIFDLKTTEDASKEAFGKSAFKYRYNIQGAFYLDGYNAANNTNIDKFIFIAVEKKAPYNVGVYYLSKYDIDIAREIYTNDLITYQKAIKTGVWAGYSNDFEQLTLPGYAYSSKQTII